MRRPWVSALLARVLLAPVLLAPVGSQVLADGSKPADPATDAELLEFLGSLDAGADAQGADAGSWIDYLAQIDVGRLASTGGPHGAEGAKQVQSGAQPPDSGVNKHE